MANYTIELHKLIEMGFKLPLDEYPIFDENHRAILNDKIIAHYYFREIGQETPSRFAFNLRRKMNEIMPYYNQLYESELIKYDPLFTTYFTSLKASERKGQGKTLSENDRKRNNDIGNVYSGVKLGDYNTDNTHTNDEVGKETGTEHKVRTDNLSENGTKNINVDETKVVTEDNEKDTSETKNIREKDDKTTTSHSETDSNTTTDRTLNKTTNFSDVPQAGIETETLPDGTVITHGYLTTQTIETEKENTKTIAHSETDGTIIEDDTKTTNITDTIKQTEDNVQNTTDNIDTEEVYEVKNTGTQTTDTDYEKNFTDKNDYVGNEKSQLKENEDNQRNITENEKENVASKMKSFTKDSEQNKIMLTGRQNVSPAELIKIYRDTLLNIDMKVINELETLFMGVF